MSERKDKPQWLRTLFPTQTRSSMLLVQIWPLSSLIHTLYSRGAPIALVSVLPEQSLGSAHPSIHLNPNHMGETQHERSSLNKASQVFQPFPASYSIRLLCYLHACCYHWTFLMLYPERGKRQRDVAERTQNLRSDVLDSSSNSSHIVWLTWANNSVSRGTFPLLECRSLYWLEIMSALYILSGNCMYQMRDLVL